jgi:hypothetical protein
MESECGKRQQTLQQRNSFAKGQRPDSHFKLLETIVPIDDYR